MEIFRLEKPRKVIADDVAQRNLLICNNVIPKYSTDDWDFNNAVKAKISENQSRLAGRIVEESRRMVDERTEISKERKLETEHKLRERVDEIKFLLEELNQQKKNGLLEEEALKTYKKRTMNAITYLTEKALFISQKCSILREGRIGPDLVEDEVEVQLIQELKIIRGVTDLMSKTLAETDEQLRRLKACMYLLGREYCNKDKASRIDKFNLSLRESQQGLSLYTGDIPLTQCDYTFAEWEHETYKNIENTGKELNTAGQLRAYIDLLLKQVIEDLTNQRDRCNEAFEKRITEVTQVKRILEAAHNVTLTRIQEVNRNINDLEKALKDQESFLAVCQMRLGNRAHRPGVEMTCDGAQAALYRELNSLKDSIGKIMNKRAENQATLRYLLHTQVLQEEEINVKANSLKIDYVDCMSLRQSLHFQSF